MKAPEDKLYINLFKGVYNVCSYPVGNAQEYTRTDAFIEKACEFLKGWDAYRVCLEGHKDWFIEQFKEAMKL